MAFTKNVGSGEGILRVVLGIILIVFGLFFSGFWKPVSLVVGGFLALTALVGY